MSHINSCTLILLAVSHPLVKSEQGKYIVIEALLQLVEVYLWEKGSCHSNLCFGTYSWTNVHCCSQKTILMNYTKVMIHIFSFCVSNECTCALSSEL